MRRLLYGYDVQIAEWAFKAFNRVPTPFVMAIGITDGHVIKGAVLLQEYNGNNVEVSWYGPFTMTRGFLREIATIALDKLKVQRMTVRIMRRNKMLNRSIRKLGFKYEGVMPGFYGPSKGDAAVVFGLYREGLEKLRKCPSHSSDRGVMDFPSASAPNTGLSSPLTPT